MWIRNVLPMFLYQIDLKLKRAVYNV